MLDGEYKLRQNIKIAMLYLEDDDAVSAEMFIKKAATLIASSKVCHPPAPLCRGPSSSIFVRHTTSALLDATWFLNTCWSSVTDPWYSYLKPLEVPSCCCCCSCCQK